MRCTPVRYTPIRYTFVGCMPVRYVLIFENGFVVLSWAHFGTYRIDDTFSDDALNDDEVLEDTVRGIESARSGDSIAVENTKFSAEIRKLGF
jgi:hypothetical protein